MNDFMYFFSLKEKTSFHRNQSRLHWPYYPQYSSGFYLSEISLLSVRMTLQCVSWLVANSKSTCNSESGQQRRIQKWHHPIYSSSEKAKKANKKGTVFLIQREHLLYNIFWGSGLNLDSLQIRNLKQKSKESCFQPDQVSKRIISGHVR